MPAAPGPVGCSRTVEANRLARRERVERSGVRERLGHRAADRRSSQEISDVAERSIGACGQDRPDLGVADAMHVLERKPYPPPRSGGYARCRSLLEPPQPPIFG